MNLTGLQQAEPDPDRAPQSANPRARLYGSVDRSSLTNRKILHEIDVQVNTANFTGIWMSG